MKIFFLKNDAGKTVLPAIGVLAGSLNLECSLEQPVENTLQTISQVKILQFPGKKVFRWQPVADRYSNA